MSKKSEGAPNTKDVIGSWPDHLPEDGDRVVTWENLKRLSVLGVLLKRPVVAMLAAVIVLVGVVALVAVTILRAGITLSRRDAGLVARENVSRLGIPDGLRKLSVVGTPLKWIAAAVLIAMAILTGAVALVVITVIAVGTMVWRSADRVATWESLKRLEMPDALRKLRVLSTPLKWTAVAVLIAMTLLAVAMMLTSYFGWDIGSVANDSMEPELSAGDAIAYCPVGIEDIKVGDIIAFHSSGDAVACRRVTDVGFDGTSTVFQTKGDANRDPDQGMVLAEDVEGRVAYCIPHLGGFVEFAGSGGGLVLLIVVPGMLIVVSEIGGISRVLSKRKRLLKGDSWLREAGLGGRNRSLAGAEEIDHLLFD